MTTNLDRWRLYCRDVFSPSHYVDWGFYSMIAAALERRVFYDNTTNPLFASMYVVLIGPAGVGKGMIRDKNLEFISHHTKDASPQPAVSSIQNTLLRLQNKTSKYAEPEMMFKLAADSTTYESLLVETVDASENMTKPDGEPYLQAALYFLLDEYTSIFKQHSEDLITFLLTAWNGKNYTRKTKHKGHDHIKNPCFNILACTTPTEFAKILRKEIIGSGIMGRTVLVYGHKNRSRGIKLPAPDAAQAAAKLEILDWLKYLKGVYQCVHYSAEAEAYLTKWYANEAAVRINPNQKLDEYYVRKLTHIHKLVMAMHFSDPGHDKPVPPETIAAAIKLLDATEVDMHLALTAGGRNELSPIANAIDTYISRRPGGVTINDVVCQFISDATFEEIEEIMQALQVQGRILHMTRDNIYITVKK